MEGLQYFEQVWRLSIYNNKIKRLDNLPPNLTDLNCANNEIELIDNLPINLKYFTCSNNRISIIKNLPPYLIRLHFSNNFMKYMPLLPKAIQYITYFNNPIPLDSLPKLFQIISCDDISQYCLPYELMNWRILNVIIKDTSLNITGMTLKLNSNGWGSGSQVETINYKLEESKLVANKMEDKRNYDKNVQPNHNDSSYYTNVNYSVEVAKIIQFLKDIYSNNMLVQVQIGDSLKSINLKIKKNGITCFDGGCSDCRVYNLQYMLYSHTDTIKLNYGFTSLLSGPTICSTDGPENIKSILDWLYIYKLMNLTFDQHKVTNYYFSELGLSRVIKWSDLYDVLTAHTRN